MVEHLTFNQVATGSSPVQPTKDPIVRGRVLFLSVKEKVRFHPKVDEVLMGRELDPKFAKFSDEERAAIAVRCLMGEKEADLAREIGVPPQVIEGWVAKVAQVVRHKEPTEAQKAQDLEVQGEIGALQAEVQRLQKQLEEMRKMAQLREVVLEARSQRPIFSK